MPLAFRFAQEFSGEPLELPPLPMEAPREGITETGNLHSSLPAHQQQAACNICLIEHGGLALLNPLFLLHPDSSGGHWTLRNPCTIQLTNEDYGNNMDLQNTLTVLHDTIYHYPSKSCWNPVSTAPRRFGHPRLQANVQLHRSATEPAICRQGFQYGQTSRCGGNSWELSQNTMVGRRWSVWPAARKTHRSLLPDGAVWRNVPWWPHNHLSAQSQVG